MGWTLKYGDVTKTFAEWGFSHLHRRTSNFRHDVVTFVQEGVGLDDDAEFDFNDEIEIYYSADDSEGTLWFTGRIRDPKRIGEAEHESIAYEAWGVLSHMDRLVFRQPWRYLTDREDPESDKYTVWLSDLVLFQKIVGGVSAIATVKEQVEEIFQYRTDYWESHDVAAKFQLDASLLPTHQAPFIEVSNVVCGMALEYALKTTPDIAVWTDYSTTPPTIRIARRADLTAVTLEIPDEGQGNGKPIVKQDIQPRSDLQVPAVVIEYRQTNLINGQAIPFTAQDIYPIGADVTADDVIPQTVNLEGANLVFPQAVLSVRTIAESTADWWKLHDTSLAKTNIQNLVIRESSRSGSLPYEVLPDSDPWAPWMGGAGEEDIIECYADWDRVETKNNATVTVEKVRNQLLQVRVMTTSKESGTYNGNAQGSFGEPMPTGMAQALYEATSERHYEGTVTIEEDECSGLVKVGNVLNLTNSKRPEWATMRAFVQSVEEDVENGRTTITVGPPKFLGVNELMDWLRGLRSSNTGGWAARVNAIAGGGPLRVAARGHKQSVLAGKEARERMVLLRPDNQTQTTETLTAKIILDILDAHGLEIKLREYKLCIDGVSWYFMALGSDKYATAKTANPIGS